MHLGHILGNEAVEILVHFNITDESISDIDEGIFGPTVEIVDGGTRHQTWELTGFHTEVIAHRGEAQDDLELLFHLVKEVVHHGIGGIGDTGTFGLIAKTIDHAVDIFFGEEVLDPPVVEDIIDRHEETLALDLRVGHHEGDRRGTRLGHLLVHFLEEGTQIVDAKVGSHDELLNVNSGDKGSETRKGLFA